MIEPTVGRVVWFWPGRLPNELSKRTRDPQPCAATVVYVLPNGLINISWFDHGGLQHSALGVPLVQTEVSPELIDKGFYCEWMPHQKGQAAKTEALEARLGAGP